MTNKHHISKFIHLSIFFCFKFLWRFFLRN